MSIETPKKGKSARSDDITSQVDKSLKNNEPLTQMVYLILGGKHFLPKAPATGLEYVTAS